MSNLKEFTGSNGDVLFEHQIVDRLISGCPSIPKIISDDVSLDFATVGDIAYPLTVKSNSTITINKGVQGQLQKMTLFINNKNDGNVIMLSSNLSFKGGMPFIKSSKGFTIIELIYDGYNTLYAKEILNG